MNIAKSKVMVLDNTPINVNNVLIENVEGYVYGAYCTCDNNSASRTLKKDKEIQRRIMAG